MDGTERTREYFFPTETILSPSVSLPTTSIFGAKKVPDFYVEKAVLSLKPLHNSLKNLAKHYYFLDSPSSFSCGGPDLCFSYVMLF